MYSERRVSAETHMSAAELRLTAGDFKLCKKLAFDAVYHADPPVKDGTALHATATALLAVATALLAAEHPGPADPYEVLGLNSAEAFYRDLAIIESKYRRISGLISSSRPNRPFAVGLAFDVAILHVDEAWAFLSDPLRKSFLDANIDAAAAAAKAAATAKANAVADAIAAAEAARAASTATSSEGRQPLLSIPSSPSPDVSRPVTKRRNMKASNQASRRGRVEAERETQPNAGEGVRRSGRLASKPNPNCRA